ncbi:MAG: hypothetical protein KDB03_25010 [Planctomycetales bacterium]|nr:hypothetical protein [Planctomycetales bacterium]
MRLLLFLWCSAVWCSFVHADIVWTFETRDDTNSMVGNRFTGVLTTTGSSNDLLSSNVFQLLSIDLINELSSSSAWYNSVTPPFTGSLSGSVAWTPGGPGTVFSRLVATDDPNFVTIAAPGSGDTSQTGWASTPGDFSNMFFPTSTTLNPINAVPEASQVTPAILLLFVTFLMRTHRDRKGRSSLVHRTQECSVTMHC